MPNDHENGRTHEPNLRELTVETDGLRDLLIEKIERLREVMTNSLSAQEKLTTQAFAASKEAITKAETAQTQYNTGHNDLLKKQDSMISRTEFDVVKNGWNEKFDAMKDSTKLEISGLRESRSEGIGKGATWNTVLVIAGIVAGVLVTYLTMAHH